MAKREFTRFLLFLLIITVSLSGVLASLDIKKETVSNLAIKDLNKPALFNLELTNNGEADSFTIYTFVGLSIQPNTSISLSQGETKKIRIEVYPTIPIEVSPDYVSFEYKIKGDHTEAQSDELAMSIAYLKDSFDFYIDPINPDSETAKVHFNNKYGDTIDNIHLEFSSVFFSDSLDFSLSGFEKKELDAKINREKMKELLAGPYIVNANVGVGDVSGDTSTIMNFEEKSGIETKTTKEGFFSRRTEIEKINKGNVKTEVNTVISKDLFSALFTTINPDTTSKQFRGFHVSYIYNMQLAPGESLKVVAKTNWWILILIIVAILVLWYLADKYIRNKIVIRKHVSFVRTRGGEFALRVSLNVKARDYAERIRLIDRLPPMVKVFEGYGNLPEKLDEKNRRLEWNIQALARGEERTYSYIIYSKIGMVGKFELPKATAIYEFEGKLKEAESNDAFYSNESKS